MTQSPYAVTEGIEHLNVPTTNVSRGAREFTVPCLYSVIEYFANHYPDEGTRVGTSKLGTQLRTFLYEPLTHRDLLHRLTCSVN